MNIPNPAVVEPRTTGRTASETLSGEAYRRLVPDIIQDADIPVVWGISAEFETPEELIAAAQKTSDAGYKRLDTYTPFPIEGLSEAMNFRDYRMPLLMLLGGLLGGLFGFFFQLWAYSFNYPYNIGGRALASWPYFVVITFEMTILTSSFFGIFGMFILNGLPLPYHPIFGAPNFDRAGTDRFFLAIESQDKQFDLGGTRNFMETLGAINVAEVFEDDPGNKKKLRGDSGHH